MAAHPFWSHICWLRSYPALEFHPFIFFPSPFVWGYIGKAFPSIPLPAHPRTQSFLHAFTVVRLLLVIIPIDTLTHSRQHSAYLAL